MRIWSSQITDPVPGFRRAVLSLLCFVVSVGYTSAQSIRSNVLSDDGRTAILEFQFGWSTSLQEAIDSSGVEQWNQSTLRKFAAGFDETSIIFNTGDESKPQISVLAREYGVVSSVYG